MHRFLNLTGDAYQPIIHSSGRHSHLIVCRRLWGKENKGKDIKTQLCSINWQVLATTSSLKQPDPLVLMPKLPLLSLVKHT